MAFGSLIGTAFTGTATSIPNPFPTTVGSATVAVGDLVFAAVAEQTNLTITAINDNLGNVYVPLTAGDDAGAITLRAFYSLVSVAGTISAISATDTAGTDDAVIMGAAFSGPFASSPLDANPAQSVNADLVTPYTCPPTGVLSQADELIIAWFARNSGTGTTITAPGTQIVQINSASVIRASMGVLVVADTASVTLEFTSVADPTQDIMGVASFKKDTGPPPPPGAGVYIPTYRRRRR